MTRLPPRGAGYRPTSHSQAIDLRKRIAELEAAIDAVRALHPAYDEADPSTLPDLLAPGKWCPTCGEEKPCKTRRALRGEAA